MAELIDRGARVVDVSADHRLHDAALYPPVYGFDAPPAATCWPRRSTACPRATATPSRAARLVANPGCFPEASILALLPLAGVDRRRGHRRQERASAGRAGRPPTTVHFSTVTDSVSPYKVYTHRHTPEIEQELGVEVTFTPHLVPVDRGLLATCYARLARRARRTPTTCAPPTAPSTPTTPSWRWSSSPPGMRAVQRTNYAQVCPMVDPRGGRVTVFGVIDNLGKGAAGQAVQNLNLMAGLPETEGLL